MRELDDITGAIVDASSTVFSLPRLRVNKRVEMQAVPPGLPRQPVLPL